MSWLNFNRYSTDFLLFSPLELFVDTMDFDKNEQQNLAWGIYTFNVLSKNRILEENIKHN